MESIDVRPTLAAPDDDPYLWLEAIEGDPALAWVDRQNRRTMEHIAAAPLQHDRDALLAIYDRADKIPGIVRRDGLIYNVWRDDKHVRGLWRRTTLESYRSEAPLWEILLDLDDLARREGEDWVWHSATTLPGAHDLALVSLSRGGSDASVHREFDLVAKSFVDGGFATPEAKGSVSWIDRDTLLLVSAAGEGMATRSGYARTIRLWRRGEPALKAPVIFETGADAISMGASVDRGAASERIWFMERVGFFNTNKWLGDRTGPKTKLDIPTDATASAEGDWLLVWIKTAWSVGEATHAAGSLLAISLARFLDGDRAFQTVFDPGPRRSLEGYVWCKDKLILSILDNIETRHRALTPSEAGWTSAPLDGLPDIGVVSVARLDAEASESNGDLMAFVQGPLLPPRLVLMLAGQAPAVIETSRQTFDATGLVVSRHEAISTDGEAIPYFQVGPSEETGDAPVHMTGYGGFGVSLLPVYDSTIGKLWLERGGVSVVANIRGGGEFGPRWHDAGKRAGRIKSHDDFAAVAADLVRRGVTRPERIAAEGGSNGGTLIANMLTRYPERFGAFLCTVPLIDMRRYTKLLAGPSWVAEYGDPDIPEDWAYLQKYSAYHTAVPGRPYPPILFLTSRKDDRVHPGHARKMAAKLQAMGYRAYFHESATGGHGRGKDNRELADLHALGLTFLRQAIGWQTPAI